MFLFLISVIFVYVNCQISGQYNLPYGQQQQPLYGQQQQQQPYYGQQGQFQQQQPLNQYGQQNPYGLQQQYPGQYNNGFGMNNNNGGAQCIFGPLTPLNGQLRFSSGSVLGPYPSGTMVTNQCNNGYTPTGMSQSTCMNGQWSPPTVGECVLGQNNNNNGFNNNQFGK